MRVSMPKLPSDPLATTTQNSKDHSSKPTTKYYYIYEYPSTKILLSYLIFGGMLGGLILWIPFAIINRSYILDLLSTALMGGAVIGIVPSYITALILIKHEIVLNTAKNWSYLFWLGAISSLGFSLFIMITLAIFDSRGLLGMMNILKEIVIIFTVITVLGGFSSLILGGIVLPKHNH